MNLSRQGCLNVYADLTEAGFMDEKSFHSCCFCFFSYSWSKAGKRLYTITATGLVTLLQIQFDVKRVMGQVHPRSASLSKADLHYGLSASTAQEVFKNRSCGLFNTSCKVMWCWNQHVSVKFLPLVISDALFCCLPEFIITMCIMLRNAGLLKTITFICLLVVLSSAAPHGHLQL